MNKIIECVPNFSEGRDPAVIRQITDAIEAVRGIQLLDVVPSSVELTLAQIAEHEVTVKPQLVGKLPGGRKIQSIELKPEKLKVFSPVTNGKAQAVSVMTTPIYLESIYEDTRLYCKIIAPPAVQPAEKRWPDIEVIITVKN